MTTRIIFQHIPKTAGSSLAGLFTSQFDRKEVFICGSYNGVLKDFLGLPQSTRDRVKLLIGHVDYGIHRQFSDGARYITFLRNPIERALSHYYFIRSETSHRYHRQARQMDINDFVLSGIRPRMNNCMTRMISGMNPPYGKGGEKMLETALLNLEKDYGFIGLFSQIDEAVNSLVRQMLWKPVEIPKFNKTRNKPDIRTIPQKTLDLLREFNHLDLKLYQIILERGRAPGIPPQKTVCPCIHRP